MSAEVPGGWSRSTLGEQTAKMVGGGTPSRNEPRYWNGSIPWASVKDLRSAHLELTEECITPEGIQASASHVIPAGTIIIATRMAVGKAVRFSKDVAINQDLRAIYPKPSMDSAFLHHWLRWKESDFAAVATGTTVKGIRQETIRDWPMVLPPLSEQRRIAEILSRVDEAIQATQAVIEQTVKVNQSVLDGLLTQSIMHTDSVETPLGPLPPSWNVCALEDVCERVTYGFTNPMPTTDSGPWMVTAANVKGGKIDYSSARKTSTEAYREYLTDKSRPAIGTVLITKDGTLGRVALVDRDDICINQSVASLVPDTNRIESDFLSYSLQSSAMQARILAESGGTSVKHIYISKLSKTLLALPPLKEQRRIAEIAKAGERNLERQMGALAQLKSTKNSVASDLLTGRRRVSTDLPLAAE